GSEWGSWAVDRRFRGDSHVEEDEIGLDPQDLCHRLLGTRGTSEGGRFTSRCRGPRTGRPPPEAIHVAYPPVGCWRTAVPSPPAALRGVPLDRQLSSRLTFFQKFVFPIFWIGMFTAATVTMFVAAAPGNAVSALRWIFLAVTVGGGAWIYWA